MFNFAVVAILRGLRTADTQRLGMGVALLLVAGYRRSRRRGGLIAAYDLDQGDEITVRLPKRWKDDPTVLASGGVASRRLGRD